jgi:predicted metal-dependent hydrolase
MTFKNTKVRVERWESALANHKELTDTEWGEILYAADPKCWEEYGEEDAPGNGAAEFMACASPWQLGQISLDFPHSLHGDGLSVEVYRLPRGTTVLTLFSTTETTGPSGLVLHTDDFGDVSFAADMLISDELDGADVSIQVLDKDEERDPDSGAYYEGHDEVWRQWSKVVVERFWYLGCHYRVKVHSRKQEAKLRGGWLHVYASSDARQYYQSQEAVMSWLRKCATRRLPERVEVWCRKVRAPVSDVAITDRWRQWGARGRHGTIRLSWRLVQAPMRLVDYVIVRELVQGRHPGHGPDFWQDVARIMPDYERRRQDLGRFRSKLKREGL